MVETWNPDIKRLKNGLTEDDDYTYYQIWMDEALTEINEDLAYLMARNGYLVDFNEADQGAAGGGGTIKDLVDAIGTTKQATIFLPHTQLDQDTTTYTFSTSESIPSNIKVVIQNGALITPDSGVTVTFDNPGQIKAAYTQQIKTGDGALSFTNGGTYSTDWFGASINATAAVNAAAIQEALDARGTNTENYTLMLPSTNWYEINSKIEVLGQNLIIQAIGGLRWTGSTTGPALSFGDGVNTCQEITVYDLRVSTSTANVDVLVHLNAARHMSFYNPYFTGVDTSTTGSLLKMDDSWINDFYNLRLYIGWDGLEIGGNCNATEFYSCEIETLDHAGVRLKAGEGSCNNIKFIGGVIENMTDSLTGSGVTGYGVLLEHTIDALSFIGTYMEANDYHIYVDHDSTTHSVYVTDCFLTIAQSGTAIYLDGNVFMYVERTDFSTNDAVDIVDNTARYYGYMNAAELGGGTITDTAGAGRYTDITQSPIGFLRSEDTGFCTVTGVMAIGTNEPAANIPFQIYRDGTATIRLSDSGATTAEEVNGVVEWYQGKDTTRVGYIGYGSSGDSDLEIWNGITDGNIELATQGDGNVIIKNSNTPASAVGQAGDKAGAIAWDASYIYICTEDYDGGNIWKRVAISSW